MQDHPFGRKQVCKNKAFACCSKDSLQGFYSTNRAPTRDNSLPTPTSEDGFQEGHWFEIGKRPLRWQHYLADYTKQPNHKSFLFLLIIVFRLPLLKKYSFLNNVQRHSRSTSSKYFNSDIICTRRVPCVIWTEADGKSYNLHYLQSFLLQKKKLGIFYYPKHLSTQK